jgi:hypothetical protein
LPNTADVRSANFYRRSDVDRFIGAHVCGDKGDAEAASDKVSAS